ncbi:MAG TPA: sensor histidine kinase [Candidatus Binatia bacterium]|nr:sensor histidine kinase [Candidatus Binatia bacterium]
MLWLQRIWHRIYPSEDEHRWMPVLWLPFMIWFFVEPIWWKHPTPLLVAGNTLYGLFFVWLYLYSFSRPEPRRLYAIVAMFVMAAALVGTHNGAVSSLLIYAVAAGGFTTNRPRVVSLIGITVGLLGIYAWHLHLPLAFWGSMLLLVLLVGIGNHLGAIAHCAGEKLRRADEEIEHLAKVAERERIARDLHDLLGHTLSLITLKAELARKLVDRDPQRAQQEMLDVERASRAALADVREAISGYRGEGLTAELVQARKTLETAGVAVKSDVAELPLSPAQETVLALALREAVTNVLRHAQARQCSVRLQRQDDLCTLEIADDGRGADAPEGHGLRGMRERLEAIGGSLQRHTRSGTRLVIHLPLAQPIASTAGALGNPVAPAASPLRN